MAGKFVIDADHVSLDELLVGFEQGDAVVLDQLDVGQEDFGRNIHQRLIHGYVDLGIGQQFLKDLRQGKLKSFRQMRGNVNGFQQARGNGAIGMNGRQHLSVDGGQIDRLERGLPCQCRWWLRAKHWHHARLL